MRLGMIGLGRMGGNMARRLLQSEFEVVGYNLDATATQQLASEAGLVAADSTAALVDQLEGPRVVWLMLPAGDVTESYVVEMGSLLSDGDILIDGANSWFRDSMRRSGLLAAQGIRFVDAGVSGGVWGLENGYALMVGGPDAALDAIEPILRTLAPAPDKGWLHTGQRVAVTTPR